MRAGMRRIRPARILATGLGAWLACGTAARAQGVLPATGVDTRVGDLRGYFAQAFGQVVPEAGTQGWTYSAGVDVSETYDTAVPITSNGNNTGVHDLITRISPSIGVTGNSARLSGSLFYAPSINIYAIHGNQNGISHNLNAAATATIIPDFFFVDVRAFAAEQAISGFNGPNGTTDVGSSNQELTTSFSISPSLRHSFGSVADAALSYTLSRTSLNANNQVAASTAQSVNQNYTSQSVNGSVSTGSDFGQFNDAVTAQASQSSGTGALSGAYSYVFSNTASYALSRSLTLTTSIGHENYYYGGGNPYTVDDVTWSGGVIWAPNPDSSISVGYGHQQGGSSFYLNATYAATAYTRIYARYSQGIGTEAQNLQTAVNSSTVNVNGVTIDRNTGQPVVVNNNFFASQTGLYRTTSASISTATLWPRDLFSTSFQYQETTQLTNAAAGVPNSGSSGSTTGAFGSIAWTHDLSDDLHSNALLQYGISNNYNNGVGLSNTNNQNSFLVNVGVSYSISASLSVSAQYTLTTGANGFGTDTGVRQIMIVSLHKTFF
jgi:uncharacterized protein (PEP-CTERM system associated)